MANGRNLRKVITLKNGHPFQTPLFHPNSVMSIALLDSLNLSPVSLLLISVTLVVVLIGVCRVHAFFALIIAAASVAVLGSGDQSVTVAMENMFAQFGRTVGGIGFAIAVAAVIGAALTGSGAADRIVGAFIAALGEKRAPLALLGAGFVLSIPVYFDTVFFLLIPLARALSARTGKNYLLHVMAICTGSVITHATVPPTPGPLTMAEILMIDPGQAMLAGLAAGILPAAAGLGFAAWLNRRYPVPQRDARGLAPMPVHEHGKLPGFAVSIAPVLIPVILIAAVSILGGFQERLPDAVWELLLFLGNKNVALLLGAVMAVAVYLRQRGLNWRETGDVVGEPLGTAGVIILITAAGGAYGAMIQGTGIGDVIRGWIENHGINPVVLGWCMAALLRAAQGSTTVAVIAAAGLMTSLGGDGSLGVHPVYLYLAIGYGGLFLSWMNDSGFWLYSRMSGMTEGETLRSWSMLLSLVSVVGLIQVWVVSSLFPAV